MDTLIDIIMLILILSSLLLLGFSQLQSCIRAVAFQGVTMGLLPVLVGHHEKVIWAILASTITIVVKGVLFPWLLLRTLRDAEVRHEDSPYVGYAASTIVGMIAFAISAWLSTRLPIFGGTLSMAVAPVPLFLIFVGLFIIVSRKKAISQILGYLVMENGIYVFGMVMLRDVPLLVDLGVLLDAFAAVFVMGVAVYHINREFEHMDVDQLDALKG
jgi:hydrogenase-4 component E